MKLAEIQDLFLPKLPEPGKCRENNFKEYQKKYENHEYLTLTFDHADKEGNLYKVYPDITVVMPAEREILSFQRYQLLLETFCVKITEIDPAHNRVWVSNQEARGEQKPEILRQLNLELRDGQQPEILGKVVKIHKRIAKGEEKTFGIWLDLCGVGIPGFVPSRFWRSAVTEELLGQVVAVTVIEKKERTKHTVCHYLCSQPGVQGGEVWLKGQKIEVKCTECAKSRWLGIANGTESMFFGNYPEDIPMIPGFAYEGRVLAQTEKGIRVQIETPVGIKKFLEEA